MCKQRIETSKGFPSNQHHGDERDWRLKLAEWNVVVFKVVNFCTAGGINKMEAKRRFAARSDETWSHEFSYQNWVEHKNLHEIVEGLTLKTSKCLFCWLLDEVL